MKEWLDSIRFNLTVDENTILALVMDQCRVHVMKPIHDLLNSKNFNFFF